MAAPTLQDPALNAAAITPSDDAANNFAAATRGIYVGGDGNIVIIPAGNNQSAVTLVGCVAGTVIPVRAIRVNATSTTATSLVRLW